MPHDVPESLPGFVGFPVIAEIEQIAAQQIRPRSPPVGRVDRRGPRRRMAKAVASRVARSDDLPKNLVNVQVVTGTFFMSEFFTGNRVPATESVRATCAIHRG